MMLLSFEDSTMPKLNDTQMILLSTASQREDGSAYPLPKALADHARTAKALAALMKIGALEERSVADRMLAHRHEDDVAIGLFVTPAGLAAIGIGDGADVAGVPMNAPVKPPSKRDAVVALLTRDGGVTSAELIAATGWLPHTMRAALTGLRKQGHGIVRGKRDDQTCYSIAGVA